MKRLIIATIGGMACGLVCLMMVTSGPAPVAVPIFWQVFFSRTLIGVAIGLSCLKLGHWAIHGFVLGLVFSLPLAFSGMMAPETVEYSQGGMFFLTALMGGIYGILIEVLTSVLFKARVE